MLNYLSQSNKRSKIGLYDAILLLNLIVYLQLKSNKEVLLDAKKIVE